MAQLCIPNLMSQGRPGDFESLDSVASETANRGFAASLLTCERHQRALVLMADITEKIWCERRQYGSIFFFLSAFMQSGQNRSFI